MASIPVADVVQILDRDGALDLNNNEHTYSEQETPIEVDWDRLFPKSRGHVVPYHLMSVCPKCITVPDPASSGPHRLRLLLPQILMHLISKCLI